MEDSKKNIVIGEEYIFQGRKVTVLSRYSKYSFNVYCQDTRKTIVAHQDSLKRIIKLKKEEPIKEDKKKYNAIDFKKGDSVKIHKDMTFSGRDVSGKITKIYKGFISVNGVDYNLQYLIDRGLIDKLTETPDTEQTKDINKMDQKNIKIEDFQKGDTVTIKGTIETFTGEIIEIDGDMIKVRIKDYVNPLSFNLRLLVDSGNIIKANTKQEIVEEEEEDEYVEVDDDDEDEDISDEELLITPIEDFFTDDELNKLTTLDDLLKYRKELTLKSYRYGELNDFQKKLLGRSIATTYLIERYFRYMIGLFPDMKIYRFNGRIPYEELLKVKNKEKVPFIEELYDMHGFDNGVIYYWIFNNGVVFKTI